MDKDHGPQHEKSCFKDAIDPYLTNGELVFPQNTGKALEHKCLFYFKGVVIEAL